MKKLSLSLLILLLGFGILTAQEKENKSETTEKDKDKKEEVRKTFQKVYQEITLEDFETTQYSDKNLVFSKTTKEEGALSVRDQYPAPFNNSKKYLGIKVYGRSGFTYRIVPGKELTLDKYTKEISIWVYGKKFAGHLDLWLQDVNGKNHRLRFGNTSFLGWKKLTVKLDKSVKQQDENLEQAKKIKILYLQYLPLNRTLHPIWQYFYIDDITATVRDKYKDRQSDNW